MPGYIFSTNLQTNRKQGCERMATFFQHVDAMNLTLTALAYSNGSVTVTISQTLTAAERAHLGFN